MPYLQFFFYTGFDRLISRVRNVNEKSHTDFIQNLIFYKNKIFHLVLSLSSLCLKDYTIQIVTLTRDTLLNSEAEVLARPSVLFRWPTFKDGSSDPPRESNHKRKDLARELVPRCCHVSITNAG